MIFSILYSYWLLLEYNVISAVRSLVEVHSVAVTFKPLLVLLHESQLASSV